MIRLYDTATKQVVPLSLREPGKVSIYVCGPTVYAAPHLGHGRYVLVYDVLRRFLESVGLDVTFVSNITDIDDNIIERGQRDGRDPAEIAIKCEEIWWGALDRINVRKPDHIPHATEYVEQMVDLVQSLLDADRAYVTSDGVYLSVEQVEGYGLLANQDLDSLREGGGDRAVVGAEKRHPADFALWKLAKEGEPSWPSPWGGGRPGWHTECVVMSLDILGEGFDIHAGGLDLAFPHHENERAQAVALGKEFASHWMHNGFVELGGEKMSKSLGNVSNLLDLTEQYDPRVYRLLILQSHYRSPIEVTEVTLSNASAALERLDTFALRTAQVAASGTADANELGADALVEFTTVMENDLDTPGAVDLLFRLVRDANTSLDGSDQDRAVEAAVAARKIAEILGLELKDTAADVPPEIQAMADQRQQARANKDFAKADELRNKLTEAGWIIEDNADGQLLKPVI